MGTSVLQFDRQYVERTVSRVGRPHHHLWVRWQAWETWGWNPHPGTMLWVCDVPDCLKTLVRKATDTLTPGPGAPSPGPPPGD